MTRQIGVAVIYIPGKKDSEKTVPTNSLFDPNDVSSRAMGKMIEDMNPGLKN